MQVRAKIVNIVFEDDGDGLIFAVSPDMPELMVSGRSLDDIVHDIPLVIKAIYQAHGEDVSVLMTEQANDQSAPWVVVEGGPKAALA